MTIIQAARNNWPLEVPFLYQKQKQGSFFIPIYYTDSQTHYYQVRTVAAEYLFQDAQQRSIAAKAVDYFRRSNP